MQNDEPTPTPVDTAGADTEQPKRGPGRPKKEPSVDVNAELLASLQAIGATINQLAENQNKLADDVNRLKNPHLPPPPEELLPPELPQGVTRFFSPHRDYTIFIEDENRLVVAGQVVTQRAEPRAASRSGDARAFMFRGHILDVDEATDPGLTSYLLNHKDYGVDFVVDLTARKQFTDTKVKQGPRGASEAEPKTPSLEASY